MNIQLLVGGANGIIHPISLVGVTKQNPIYVDEGCQVDVFIRQVPLLRSRGRFEAKSLLPIG